MPQEQNINFINIGRLSPEKDQEKLIKAFANIVRDYNQARLYIVGEGPLENYLKGLVHSLQLSDKVYFTGQIDNGFVLVNNCDCFVLSSNYEGQGLVLLESLIIGKPTIGTNVTGVRSILEEGYGLLVENSQEAVEEGMRRFIRGDKLSTKTFDYVTYNKEALQMFYEKVCEEK